MKEESQKWLQFTVLLLQIKSEKAISDITNGINIKCAWIELISLGQSLRCSLQISILIEPKMNLLTQILSNKLGDG